MTDERRQEDCLKTPEASESDVINGDMRADIEGKVDGKRELSAQLEAAEETAAGYLAQLTRLQADFINFRRRMERERAEQIRYANEQLLRELLPVVDNLERAIEAGANADSAGPLLEGVSQVLKQFLALLQKEGVTPLDSGVGQPFDPNYQEALMREEGEAEVVVEELLRGWRYHERVIRPTLVRVGPLTSCAQVATEAKAAAEITNAANEQDEEAIETAGIKEVEQ